MNDDKLVPDILLARLVLKELSLKEEAAVHRLLRQEPGGVDRLARLQQENIQILRDYPRRKDSCLCKLLPSTGALIFTFVMIGLLILIALPNFSSYRPKAYDASALSAGRSAKLAAEIYFDSYPDEPDSVVDTKEINWLDKLLTTDRNLTDDAGVTFTFTAMDKLDFTFTTQHSKGNKTFIYKDDIE